MIIGITGPHRTGKTTLAKAYAEKHGIIFLETSATAVFRSMGLNPAETYDFETRLNVQEKILEVFEELYKKASVKSGAITDRTPLDLIAYTMADAVGDVVPEDQQARLKKYVQKCFDVYNKYFALCVLVPPAIPVVYEEGKASSNQAYIDHLQLIFRALIVDDRTTATGYRISMDSLSVEKRLAALEWAVQKNTNTASDQLSAFRLEGRLPS